MMLTRQSSSAILSTAGNKSARTLLNPVGKGVKTPIQGVFYCPKKILSVLCRAISMVARIGPLQSGPDPLPGVENPLRVAAQKTLNFWRRFSILCKGKTAMNTQATGKICPANTQHPDAVNDFLSQILDLDNERQSATDAGIPALIRLAVIAERDTGQAETVRLFLLGLYNGYAFPFNLVKLRSLDKSLFDDCLLVLTLDARVTAQEIHLYFNNGGELFERWARMAGGEQ